ncbi:MAG: glycerol-3-phosphate 1-O-acyltransferase PlsY [Gemmatimonadota bacterium]
MTVILPWILLAYLVGSIPTAWLVGRAFGVDLREEGSGNLGGTNAYRVLGARGGLPVILVDILKGYFPAAFFPQWDGSAVGELALVYGLLAIMGHVWPVWLRFRGGKGVATGAGVLIALAPFAALVATLVWVGIVFLTRTVSVASLAAASVVPLAAAITDAPWSTTLFCAGVAIFVWWTHRSNLARIARGEELKFGASRSDLEEGNES